MNQNRASDINKINYLNTETEALYHQASLKLGVTDSVSIVLYTIYHMGEICLLSDVYKKSGISKQTINSAMRSLEAEGILYLEQHTGRSKKIILTNKGKDYVNSTAAKLFKAQVQAFDSWSTEEINTYIGLMEKYKDCFKKQVDAL